jgi:hypothetical protein
MAEVAANTHKAIPASFTKNARSQDVTCQGKKQKCVALDQEKGTIRLGQELNVRQKAHDVSACLLEFRPFILVKPFGAA